MMWWIFQKDRFSLERAAVSELESKVGWLEVGKWQADPDNELAMCLTFQVLHLNRTFHFKMVYPSVFPDSPPMIYTEDKTRVSLHQYGASGELCLEHRPDNWQSSISGSDMIESVYRLLVEEQGEEGYMAHAQSAHIPSLGRDTRIKTCRFLLTEGDLNALKALTERKTIRAWIREHKVGGVFISSLLKVGDKENPIWTSNLNLPDGNREEQAFVVRFSGAEISEQPEVSDLKKLLETSEMLELYHEVLQTDSIANLIMGDKDNWVLLTLFGSIDERKLIRYTTIKIPEHKNRLPDQFLSLSDKKVGLVGCGSVGSKVAASLCRSGVGNFLLIDEDIFFPDNIVRNDLDLNYVGAHKAPALQQRLQNINPSVDTQILRLSLGGQESSSSMSGALESLGNCDLIIDATAEPLAFNLIASVSVRKKKPMIWVEVFGGGIGGLVARSRPELDPVPLSARAQIYNWCEGQGVEFLHSTKANDYSAQVDDDTPLIANDAEVSIMSAHATQFATDILARPEASIFPYSAYIVGMSSEWLFQQPFDTRPIDLLPEGQWGETAEHIDSEEIIQLLQAYLPPKDQLDANSSSE
ncbi:hypothetical protein EBN99_20290 [Vibrio parahaemolyticus]|nr:hypothetical protein [Vibrio parahaemolyticus]MBM5084903.1 ThiF family adenylyltransferase [Vibrio parahaemolyticus]